MMNVPHPGIEGEAGVSVQVTEVEVPVRVAVRARLALRSSFGSTCFPPLGLHARRFQIRPDGDPMNLNGS